MKRWLRCATALAAVVTSLMVLPGAACASEADLVLPKLDVLFTLFGKSVPGTTILWIGIGVCLLGMLFGLLEYLKIKALPVHRSMSKVSELIYATCKTYLLQQGKLLILLEVVIGGTIFY